MADIVAQVGKGPGTIICKVNRERRLQRESNKRSQCLPGQLRLTVPTQVRRRLAAHAPEKNVKGSSGFLCRSPRLVPSPRYFAELRLARSLPDRFQARKSRRDDGRFVAI